jgi:hypothetical protein
MVSTILSLFIKYKQIEMPSSEVLACEECGAIFSTIEALNEHRRAENEDKKLCNAGFADG